MGSLVDLTLLGLILAGAVVGGGLLMLVIGLIPTEPKPKVASTTVADLRATLEAAGRRVPLALGTGVAVLLLTGWVVLAVASGALVFFWNSLFGGAGAEKAAVAKLEGLAAWTESLRDTIAGAVGLEQAIPATAEAAAPAISRPLQSLADRLRVRAPMPLALQRFADEIDDPAADLIVSALVLNARLRGPGLRDVLTSLAHSVRQELEMRGRVMAGRRATRRSVQIVVGVSAAFMIGLRLLNPDYVEPYGTFIGQVVLAMVVGLFAIGFFWLRRLASFATPERFLKTSGDSLAEVSTNRPRAQLAPGARSAQLPLESGRAS